MGIHFVVGRNLFFCILVSLMYYWCCIFVLSFLPSFSLFLVLFPFISFSFNPLKDSSSYSTCVIFYNFSIIGLYFHFLVCSSSISQEILFIVFISKSLCVDLFYICHAAFININIAVGRNLLFPPSCILLCLS